jgi:hypothetical protein
VKYNIITNVLNKYLDDVITTTRTKTKTTTATIIIIRISSFIKVFAAAKSL